MYQANPTIAVQCSPNQTLPFLGPYPLHNCSLPSLPGLYAVLVKQPYKTTYDVIYVGQSSNLAERGFPQNHHAYRKWLGKVNNANELHVAYHLLPGSAEEPRRELETMIIQTYNPPCNSIL